MTETTANLADDKADGKQRPRLPLSVLPIIEIAMLALLMLYPIFITYLTAEGEALDFNNYFVVRVTSIILLAMLAVSFDLCWGYSGIMSFGQALFFGIGGYFVAKLSEETGMTSMLIIIPAGMLVGLISALLVGWFLLISKRTPTIIFVALGSLTASFAAERLVAGWQWVGAGNGMSIWDFPTLFGTDLEPGIGFYYLAVACLLIAYLASRYLVRSQFGLALAGIRQNEDRLAFLGYRLQAFKLIVFSFAGLIAGWGGAIYAFHEGFVGPATVGVTTSTYAVLYGLFGGVGTLIGPVIGAGVIEGLTVILSDNETLKAYWPIALGAVMLVVVAYQPTGLVGLLVTQRERFGSFGIRKGKKSSGTDDAGKADGHD